MNAQQFEVAFYEAMHKWVTGGKVGPDPRAEWELADVGDPNWIRSCGMPQFEAGFQYRWKPTPKRTVTINGVEVVAPEVDMPTIGTVVFIETANGCVAQWGCNGEQYDKELLAHGKFFLTREDCQAMADVQRKQRIGGSGMSDHTPGFSYETNWRGYCRREAKATGEMK